MASPVPRPETIEKLVNAVYPSFAILAGMQLEVFTPLKDGPLSAEHLAQALGVHPAKLTRLLYALVVAGLLTVDGDRFANTPEAHEFLVRGRPAYRGGSHEGLVLRWHAALQTAATIRAGSPQAKQDYAAMSHDRLEVMYRGIHAEAVTAARELVARYDVSSARSLADVGGGSGGLALTVAHAYPHLHATVIDLPTVTPITRRYVEEAGLADRVHVLTADVVHGPLTGAFEVAVMSRFLQMLSADQARGALRQVSEIIVPGGMLYIVGQVIDNTRLSPPEPVLSNLFFLNVFDEGQSYTEHEYRDWLTEAGFAGIQRVVLPNHTSLLSARKPR
jgi:ubiquinone/menaquinone biosynthesis C-methylase UbiE